MVVIKGIGASPSDAYGILRFELPAADSPASHAPSLLSADDEELRFREAVKGAQHELERLENDTARRIGTEEAAIFGVQKMLAGDEDFTEHVLQALHHRKTAEQAIKEACEAVCEILEGTKDEYLRRRTGDVKDVSARLLRLLAGKRELCIGANTEPFILAANDIPPSKAATLDPKIVLGIATEQGSVQGHTAILARTLRIPAVVNLGKIPREWEGRHVLLRGDTGELLLDPEESVMEEYRRSQEENERKLAQYQELHGKANETIDGHRIAVYANAASPREIRAALENDADGIGLFRSEIIFLSSDAPPDENTQFSHYRKAAELLEGRKLIIRTLDIGADKNLPYWQGEPEENPALGLRAIRFSLSHPDIFLTQLRAILRASAYGDVAVMFPMIATVKEVQEAKALLRQAQEELDKEQKPFRRDIEIGIMIETPAAALIAEDLANEVDFFSIGTNDLTQYTLAADRQNPTLSRMLPFDHKAVFRLIRETVDAAHRAGIWCGICGDLGSDPSLTEKLIGMEIDELSVLPSSVLPIRAAIRRSYFKSPQSPRKE